MEYREERLADVEREVLPLMRAHWQETEVSMYGKDPGLCIEAYRPAEIMGILCIITAREHGVLHGYAAFFVTPNPQMGGKLVATLAGLFLDAYARKGWAGLQILRVAEGSLKERGAVGVSYNSPESKPCDVLYHRLGAKKKEVVYYKPLGGA